MKVTSFGRQLSGVQIPKTQLVFNTIVYEILRHNYSSNRQKVQPHNR